MPSFRLSLEEPVGANFSHLGQEGLFFAAVVDPSIKRLKRWNLNQWVTIIVCLDRSDGYEGNAIVEPKTENDELIRQDISLIFEVVKHKLAAFFMKEKAKGRLVRKANEEELADFCIATIQGGMLLGKIKRDSRPVEIALREGMIHLRRFAVSPGR